MLAPLVLSLLSADPQVEVEVRKVVPAEEGSYAVLLAARGEDTMLPIFIGPAEAQAIRMKLERQTPPRPMTHDLLDTMIRALGGKVTRVFIDDLKSNTFLAKITVTQGNKTHEIDARPSDSIALALRANAPIFTARHVLDAAGVTRDEPKKDDDAAPAPAPAPAKPPSRRLGPGGSQQL